MTLLSSPRIVVVNSAGQPYALAKMYTYRAGTLTNLPTYTDGTYNTEHANPVIADANGVFDPVYTDPTLGYDLRIIIKDQNDVAISGYDIDNIPRAESFLTGLDVDGDAEIDGTLNVIGVISATTLALSANTPRLQFQSTDATTNKGVWDHFVDATNYKLRTRTDAGGTGKDVIAVVRGTGTDVGSIAIGNADLPTLTLNGSTVVASRIPQLFTGSFPGALTGMLGADVPVTVYYVYTTGGFAYLYTSIAATGTSDDTAMTLTGIPAALRPAKEISIPVALFDNSARVGGFGTIAAAGSVINFVTSFDGTLAFTNVGTKGLNAGFTMGYPLA